MAETRDGMGSVTRGSKRYRGVMDPGNGYIDDVGNYLILQNISALNPATAAPT